MKKTFTFRLLIAYCFVCASGNVHAAPYFDFSSRCQTAYAHTMALRLNEAQTDVVQLKQAEPENFMALYIENYITCVQLFIDEDYGKFQKREGEEENNIKRLQKGNPQSPYFLYTQAQARLCWAMNRAKFGEYFSAFNEASTAYSQLEKNRKKFPSFVPNKLSLGVLHAIIGSIPDEYKWGVKLLSGMEGTVQQGQNEIEEVIEYGHTHDFAFEQEANIMYGFLMLHLKNDNASAWNVVANSKLKPKESLLGCFTLANIAMRTGKTDKAIELLQNRPIDDRYYPMPYLDYMLGIAKMNRGDTDAGVYIHQYLAAFKGRNYIKEAWQRLGWIEALKGDESAYRACLANCKTKGYASVDRKSVV